MVTEVTRRARPVVRWRGLDGTSGERPLSELTVRERMLLFTEGPKGLEPLWLWLNEQGMPFGVHSWEGVFRAANERCERVLTPPGRIGLDPHQVFAPYATPHSARHSFALYMLVVLNELMDQKYGLTAEERRDFRQLYGDPWCRHRHAGHRRARGALHQLQGLVGDDPHQPDRRPEARPGTGSQVAGLRRGDLRRGRGHQLHGVLRGPGPHQRPCPHAALGDPDPKANT